MIRQDKVGGLEFVWRRKSTVYTIRQTFRKCFYHLGKFEKLEEKVVQVERMRDHCDLCCADHCGL